MTKANHMHRLTTRAILVGTLLVSALGISCTGSPTEPRRSLPPRPSFALATDTVPVPTPVSVAIDSVIDPLRVSVLVTWIDNDADPSELNTCIKFTATDGAAVTTQCVYASEYDIPAGSTGLRTGRVITSPNITQVAQFRGSRHYRIETTPGDSAWYSPHSALSDPIDVVEAGATSTTKAKGRKPQ